MIKKNLLLFLLVGSLCLFWNHTYSVAKKAEQKQTEDSFQTELSLPVGTNLAQTVGANPETMKGNIGDKTFTFLGEKYVKKTGYTYYLDNSASVSNKINSYSQYFKSIENAVKKGKQSITLYVCTTNAKMDFVHYKEPLLTVYDKKKKKSTTATAYSSHISDERPYADYERVINKTNVQVLWDITQLNDAREYKKYATIRIQFTYFKDTQPVKIAHTIDDVSHVLDEAATQGEDIITLCMYYNGSTKDMEDVTYFNTFAGGGDTNCISTYGNLLSDYRSIINRAVVPLSRKDVMVEGVDGESAFFDWKSIPITSSKFTVEKSSIRESNFAQCVYYCKLKLHYVTDELAAAGIPYLETDTQIQETMQQFVANKEYGFLGYVSMPDGQEDSMFKLYAQWAHSYGMLLLRLYDTQTDYYILSNY